MSTPNLEELAALEAAATRIITYGWQYPVGMFPDVMQSLVDAQSVCDAYLRLRAELASVREDAERFRWLASQAQMHSPQIDGRHSWRIPGHRLTGRGQDFAAAIDAAMKGESDAE